jgi:hypothetical protein
MVLLAPVLLRRIRRGGHGVDVPADEDWRRSELSRRKQTLEVRRVIPA